MIAENPADLEDQLDEICKYRLLAEDSSVAIGNLYSFRNQNQASETSPATLDLNSSEATIFARGHALWLTAQGAAVDENELLRSNNFDDDGDGVKDDHRNLVGTQYFVVVRGDGTEKLVTKVRNETREFMVYDYKGNPLWILSKPAFEASAPPATMSGWPNAADQVLTKAGLARRVSTVDHGNPAIANFSGDLAAPGRDMDSDGIPADTAVYKLLKLPLDSSTTDSDDDGIYDDLELAGTVPGWRQGTDHDDPYSPLINRALQLHDDGAYAQVKNFDGPKLDDGFTLELWFKLDPANSSENGALLQKSSDDPTRPGDFWFGFVDGYLTLKYRNLAKQSMQASFKARKFLDAELGWVHAAASIKKDPLHPTGAMRVNFVVFADGLEYNSEDMQILGVENLYSGVIDNTQQTGDLIFGQEEPGALRLSMDELRIWETVRSASEINQLRHHIIYDVSKEKYLRSYYRFDDGGIYANCAKNPKDPKDSKDRAEMKGAAKFHEIVIESSSRGAETYEYLWGDSDGDKIPDFWERRYFDDLSTADSGTVDFYTDYDGDGLNDYYEFVTGRHPREKDDPALYDIDEDGDGLTLLQEQKFGSDPYLADSDFDGLDDYAETSPWGGSLHRQASNPNYSISRWDGDTLSPNLALDLAAFGSGGLELPKAARFVSKTGSYALEAWFKPGSMTDGELLRIYSAADSKTILSLGLESGKAVARHVTEKAIAAYTLQPGTWYYLSAVLDQDKKLLSIIIDGLDIVNTALATVSVYGYEDAVKAHLGGLSEGLLDEVKVFTCARAISEVNAQRHLAADQQTLGLVAYYRFDDGGLSIEDFCHSYPAALGDKPAAYALPASPGWRVASDAPVSNDLPGAIPNCWAAMYKSPQQLEIKEFKGHFYELVHFEAGTMSWSEAQKAAIARGGSLAVISSAEENAFIYNLLEDEDRGVWIGLNDN
ncbi:MAG: LamG-like jellyroll fold domain-containing protein, partial [Lentisphaeria bacterium]